ncbi:MAG TPA: hypothetical protein VNV87_00800 [Acidimicrobiales bacterium]|nr:hypothetical protein [Acidimicrobiales bacterium]
MSLQEAVDEIFRLCGEDGEAQAVLTFASEQESDPQFTSEEHIALKDLAARLYQSCGEGATVSTTLGVINPNDELFGPAEGAGSTTAGSDDSSDDSSSGPLDVLRRFREAVYRLFGGSVEEEVTPTVLALLVGPTRAAGSPDSEAAQPD